MFELLIIQDEEILQPGELLGFHKSLEQKLKDRYENKLVPDIGLCVALKKIGIKDKIVVAGEGSVQVKVLLHTLIKDFR